MATQEASPDGLRLDLTSDEPVAYLPGPTPPPGIAVPPATLAEQGAELVTVLVPAMNEEDFIGPCLDSILTQDHTNLQVIVVDGGSSDRTVEIVQVHAARDDRVELHSNSSGTIASSLNIGLDAAEGRWLVRVDAHSRIPPTYVSGLVGHLRTGRWGGVGGRKDGVASTPTGRAIGVAMSSRFGVGNSIYHHGTRVQVVDHVPFGAYPIDLLRELGGWDERLHANEDFELDYRIGREGHELLFDPAVAIDWQNRQTLGDLFRQYRRYGRGKARVAVLHPMSVKPRHLAAPALVASWLLAVALAPVWPAFAAVALVSYAAGVLVASALTARKIQGWEGRLAIPAAFLAMHVGWGIGFWEGLAGEVAGRLRSGSRR
jgi:succinoglycan biosynthesis protein ExoA